MIQRTGVKPAKPVLVMGLVVAVAMLIFGVFFFSAVLGDSGGEPGPAIGFMAVWFLVLGVIIFYFAYYLRTRKSVVDIETETGAPAPASGAAPAPAGAGTDFDARLRKLEGLKKDGLVADEEYRAKRAEILGEKW
jgi:hypothetical protein